MKPFISPVPRQVLLLYEIRNMWVVCSPPIRTFLSQTERGLRTVDSVFRLRTLPIMDYKTVTRLRGLQFVAGPITGATLT